MSDIDPEKLVVGDKSGIDLAESRPSLKALLAEQEQRLADMPDDCDPADRARLRLDIAETQLGLQEKNAAWTLAREVFDDFLEASAWQDAIEACDVMFQCEQKESLAALGNGIWLAVTSRARVQAASFSCRPSCISAISSRRRARSTGSQSSGSPASRCSCSASRALRDGRDSARSMPLLSPATSFSGSMSLMWRIPRWPRSLHGKG